MTVIRPMKADNKPFVLEEMLKKTGHLKEGFLLGSNKMDGIRAFVKDGVVLSNSMKPIPSKYVQDKFRGFMGADGELICGEPNAPDVYTKTYSAVMTHNSNVPVTFYVFDLWDRQEAYNQRLALLQARVPYFQPITPITVVSQKPLWSVSDIVRAESDALEQGYEGLMLRRPDRPYKFGRSSNLQGNLIKLKRIQDAEAEIIGFEELLRNNNEATTSAAGYTVRTSHKANKEGQNTLGSLVVVGINEPFKDVEFNIGVFKGFSKDVLKKIWDTRTDYLGKTVRYQYFGIGVKDAPRHPRMTGFRSTIDI